MLDMAFKRAAQSDWASDWRAWCLAGLGAGAAAYVAALISQYVFGLVPCTLCLWQRAPYVLGLAAAGAGLAIGLRGGGRLGAGLIGLGAAAFIGGAGLAVFHTGVEFGWWDGLSSCAPPIVQGEGFDAFMQRMTDAPPASCAQRAPFLFGLSMTNWNVLVSLLVAGLLAQGARLSLRRAA